MLRDRSATRRWCSRRGSAAPARHRRVDIPPRGRATLAALAWVVPALSGCGGPNRVAPAERALEARRDGLAAYLAATRPLAGEEAARPLLTLGDVLLVVGESLIEKLVSAMLPFEREIADRYRVRVDGARVTLRPGVALVELSGRVSPLERSALFADITLLGALEVTAGPPVPDGPPSLSASVEVFGVDAREVRIGALSPPAERLVSGLARARLDALNEALEEVPIPLRLEETIALPGVEETEVTIPAGSLDLAFELRDVRVLERGIFISLGVDRTGGGAVEGVEPDTAATEGEP